MKKRLSRTEKRLKRIQREKDEARQAQTEKIESWERKKRFWYNLYLFVGIGVNFLLYFTKPYGFDPSGSILWGCVFGIGIPLTTMFSFSYIHRKLIGI